MAKRLKLTDRDALRDWEEEIKSILSSSTIDEKESYADKRNRIARLEANDEEWFKYYFEKYYTCEPADFHEAATHRIMLRDRLYEVRAWSRELAKSARSMMEIIKLCLTGRGRNVLLISSSQDNAERLLRPFMLTLEHNKRIANDYGEQKKHGAWEEGEFTTLLGVAFRALGAGQSPRGTRNENFRPDIILIDDIDTDEECRNPMRIKTKWEWVEQALIPTLSVSGKYRILFNGNIIAKDCCIARAIERAKAMKNGFVSIVNIRDKKGRSTWKKNSEEDIDEFLSMMSTASVQKEFYNNPVSEGDVFKEMVWGKVPPLNRFRFLVAYGDPAPSNSKNGKGSYKSVFLLGFADGKYYVITGFLDHVTNAEFTRWYYDLRDYVKDKATVYNFIENNSLQNPFFEQVFIPLFLKEAEQKGTIAISEDERAKPEKFSRIEGNLEPLNRMGNLILNEAEKSNPHMKRLEDQFLLLSPQLKTPSDGPDCIEGGVWIINEKLTALQTDTFSVGTRRANKKRY